jgi:MFS family permease
MGTHGGGIARAQHPLVRLLLVTAGVILLIAGAGGALFMLAFLLFSGLDLMEEVGSTGEGAGGAVTTLIALCAIIAIFGWSLIRPDDRRSRRNERAVESAGPAPIVYQSPRVATGVLVAALILAVATVALFVLSQQLQINALLGWAFLGGILQLTLAIVGFVLSRSAQPTRRRRYRIAGWVSAATNPITLIALLFVISMIRDLAPR